MTDESGLTASFRRSSFCTLGMLAAIWSMFAVEGATHALGRPDRLLHLGAAPAVAQGNGDSALGGGLADDVLVEFVDDFLRGHLAHDGVEGKPRYSRVSMVWF